jgi:AbrB family looped-hinge helix DNA binding protein
MIVFVLGHFVLAVVFSICVATLLYSVFEKLGLYSCSWRNLYLFLTAACASTMLLWALLDIIGVSIRKRRKGSPVKEVKLTIGSGGRINLPARQRRVLGLAEGDEVVVGVEGSALRIESRDAAIDRVQRKVRERFGDGRSLSDELISERRDEAAKEAGEMEDGLKRSDVD